VSCAAGTPPWRARCVRQLCPRAAQGMRRHALRRATNKAALAAAAPGMSRLHVVQELVLLPAVLVLACVLHGVCARLNCSRLGGL
jgi:hypothetical protein